MPIELRFCAPVEAHFRRIGFEVEQEPPLFLADAKRQSLPLNEFLGQPIAQPIARDADELDILRQQTHLFP
jgi:hypothetical protein